MSTITEATAAPHPVRFTRHAVGLLVAALANPLIYFDRSPIAAWLATVAGSLAIAAALYGIFWLFFTRRARAAGPARFVLVLWFSMGLMLLGSVSGSWRAPSPGADVIRSAPGAAAPEPDWENGVITPPPTSN